MIPQPIGIRFVSRATIAVTAVDERDEPTGKAHLDFAERAADREVVLLAALVAPELRGRGIGTELMHTAESVVCAHGYRAIVLGVEDSNAPAKSLYERLGYEAFATDNFVYVGAPSPNPGVWMRKELEC